MKAKIWTVAGLAVGLCAGACAQAKPGASASDKTQGPEATSGFGKDANYANLEAHQHGSIFFMGHVAVEDAPMPWDPIPVEVVCSGVVRYRTMTDAKSEFMIQPAPVDPMHSEVSPTVQDRKRATAAQLIGCDIHAPLAGFKSTSLHIANTSIMDDPDLGTIKLTPDSGAAGSTMSATYATASPGAMKDYDQARKEYQDGKAGGAEHDLQKAVKADPKFADAWYQLGNLQREKKPDEALTSYQKAAAADPKFVSPYMPIASIAATEKKWKDVTDATSQALKLDPAGTPQLWYYDAVGNYNQGNVDAAETSANKSLAMDPQHMAPNTEQLLAVMLAGQGQLAEALHHLQNSLTYVKPGPSRDLIEQQIAQLQKAGAQ